MNINLKVFKKNIGKLILQHIKRVIHHDQLGVITGMQVWFSIRKLTNVINHINKINNKNHMIISTDIKYAFAHLNREFQRIARRDKKAS